MVLRLPRRRSFVPHSDLRRRSRACIRLIRLGMRCIMFAALHPRFLFPSSSRQSLLQFVLTLPCCRGKLAIPVIALVRSLIISLLEWLFPPGRSVEFPPDGVGIILDVIGEFRPPVILPACSPQHVYM